MATQEPRGPDDGVEPSSAVNPSNMHFFRPNDGIYVSEGPEQRTICVSRYLPAAMARNGDWHVEQFELHKELYRGKTSLLYMATDKISGVQVALKLYRKRKLSVLNRYQVEREVRLHINLHHENIIHLFAAFEDEKHVYMVQEFAVCGDLFEDLKKGGGQLKEKYAVRDVIVPFLSALAYLHNQGIIHRDIKPENILLGPNKAIKVADFGLSININHERPVTRAGTLDYMAPEVLVCPDKRRPEENKDKVLLGYTAQVDSWAVGILAYELLVGYPPFEQESRAATYEHIMYKEPKFPSWMTEEAKKFIGLALCKNASQRPTVLELMQHSWVQPYMMRHLQPAPSSGLTPGPSRLRNSVSHTSGDSGVRESVPSSSTNGMLAPHAHQHVSISASGMAPTGTAVAAPSGMAMGTGGRLFVPVPAPPVSAPAAASTNSVSAQQSTADSGALKQSHTHVQTHPHAHAQMHSYSQQLQQSQPQSVVPTPSHRQQAVSPNVALKTSISLHEKPPPGSQDTLITGVGAEGGRIHDSISDPSARAFDTCSPHPPGATSSASLYSGGGGVGGSGSSTGNRGTCGAPADMDRTVSQSQGHSVASGVSANGGGGLRGSQLPSSGPSTGSLGARGLVHVPLYGNTHVTSTSTSNNRMPAPPLTLDPVEATSDLSCGGASSTEHVPISPSTATRSLNGAGMGLGPGGTPMASRTAPPSYSQPGAQGVSNGGGISSGPSGTVAPPRLRMAALVPPVNISASAMSGSSVRMLHAPAPPISPKPPTPDMSGAYHRPASGVLSDDSFLPPTRSPSISLGTQLLSPLQAQLLAPRPSSRLNSPSHSRRNSVSQAGQASGQTSAAPALQQVSMPLPQLLGVEYSDLSTEESAMRTSISHRGLMTAPTSGASGSKLFGKMWTRDPISSGGAPPLNVVCSADSLDSPVPGAGAGGGMIGRGGSAAAAIAAGPVAASAAGGARVTARVRMMTPDEMISRPLMRESSMSSSFKSSGGGMREDLMQQSMTVYHRPGKVPGIGRAALAAREADAAEAANLSLGHGPSGGLGKTKSLVNRNLNGVLAMEEGGCGGAPMARMGSDAALARTAAGAAAAAAASGHAVATQRSFTSSNSAFARKLANGAIATKVTEYVKGRLPHDEDMTE
ncbi:hypothetical protein VaNZ11_007390 [Volvox africanus]|uniref:Protein kinase domain-containing protein n=1 Tax=Volvox africanus TaxID=51714 RepID=A0ABQ5S421_9CHLO|nr:hypothetical protein VaNZ11_007390 [Volvox africanus]